MTRKPITERMKVDCLLWLSGGIRCAICRDLVSERQEIEWDHSTPLALGGQHSFVNIRPLHKKCHAQKTFGSSATTAGSDVHMIAKTKGTRAAKFAVNKPPVDQERPDKGRFGRRPFVRAK